MLDQSVADNVSGFSRRCVDAKCVDRFRTASQKETIPNRLTDKNLPTKPAQRTANMTIRNSGAGQTRLPMLNVRNMIFFRFMKHLCYK